MAEGHTDGPRLEGRLPRPFSPAQRDVLRLLLDGRSYLEIARARGTSSRTVANQIAEISPQGQDIARFPSTPLTGDNGSPVPFDNPSSAWFDGRNLMVANQSYIQGDAANQAILNVHVGERGLRELIPRGAGR